ncbi:MAG TPA: NTP transferase domain-containing protein [Ignavibacteriaceae bacterium]
MSEQNTKVILEAVKKYSSGFNADKKEIAIILAAGHGKRLKSEKSKMLHTILGIPTVERVLNACQEAVKGINISIVVGIKAVEVMEAIGKRKNTIYAYQEVQMGTGHAVQVALEGLKNISDDSIVYILPGDMGLIDSDTIIQLRENFIKSKSDMIVLTGMYEGKTEENYYGRIIRAKDESRHVIQIMEHKDILALPDQKPFKVNFRNKEFSFTKSELINNNEYNSGVFAFKYGKLAHTIGELKTENVQGEIYITDLIDIYNKKGYSVSAMPAEKNYVVMGFNTQEVLQEMNEIAKKVFSEK